MFPDSNGGNGVHIETFSQKVILIGSLNVYPMTVLSASGDLVERHGWGHDERDWSWNQKRWNNSWTIASSVGRELFDGLVLS